MFILYIITYDEQTKQYRLFVFLLFINSSETVSEMEENKVGWLWNIYWGDGLDLLGSPLSALLALATKIGLA